MNGHVEVIDQVGAFCPEAEESSARIEDISDMQVAARVFQTRNLRELQAITKSGEEFRFDADAALMDLAFDLRSWLGLERDSTKGHASKRQDLLVLALGVVALLLLTVAANNSGAFHTIGEIEVASTPR